jgi:glycosyltransferase involved in cell wall biosynthesis
LKKRIAVIGLKGLPSIGGAARVGESLILHLKNDFDFTVYATSNFAKDENYFGIKQVIFKANSNPTFNTFAYYIKCLFHVIFIEKYDLVHLHHAESGFITPFLRFKYKVITTYHGIFRKEYVDPKFSKSVNLFFKISQFLNLYFSSLNVFTSKPDYAYFQNNLKNKEMIYISNGVDIMDFEDTFKEEYICFAAARIYQIKGLHILLNALQKINSKKRLLVIGDLEQIPSYRREILSLAEGQNVEFHGLIKQKEKLFELISKAQIFVFPSITEAMSMMLLEVASLKVPIIASDIPANQVIFKNDEALFFESNNSDSLAEKIEILNSDEALRDCLAKKAFNKVEKEYTWEKVSKFYRELYFRFLCAASSD